MLCEQGDWPLFCRKHYQRATYNQKLWQSRKITLMLRQFNIIEAQFPGTKYIVAPKKTEEVWLAVVTSLMRLFVCPPDLHQEKTRHMLRALATVAARNRWGIVGQPEVQACPWIPL